MMVVAVALILLYPDFVCDISHLYISRLLQICFFGLNMMIPSIRFINFALYEKLRRGAGVEGGVCV